MGGRFREELEKEAALPAGVHGHLSACESSPLSKEVGDLLFISRKSLAFSGDFLNPENSGCRGTPETS